MLVELAIERQQALPALIYESRPAGGYRGAGHWGRGGGATAEAASAASDDPEAGLGGQQQQHPVAGGPAAPVVATRRPPSGVVVEQELSTESPLARRAPGATASGGGGGGGSRALGEGKEGDDAGPYVKLSDAEAAGGAGAAGSDGRAGGWSPTDRTGPKRGSIKSGLGADGAEAQQPLIAGPGDGGSGDGDAAASRAPSSSAAPPVKGFAPGRLSAAGGGLGGGAPPSPPSSVSSVFMGLASTAVVPTPTPRPSAGEGGEGPARPAAAAGATTAGGAPAGAAAGAGGGVVGAAEDPDGYDMSPELPDGVKLGLGDFIFYSMLVGKAAMYDMMTVRERPQYCGRDCQGGGGRALGVCPYLSSGEV